jgi:hypothetical protein
MGYNWVGMPWKEFEELKYWLRLKFNMLNIYKAVVGHCAFVPFDN